MSVDQEIQYDGKTLLTITGAGDFSRTKGVWVTGGIEGSDTGDCIIDVEVTCDPSDSHGEVVFLNPFTTKKEEHKITTENSFSLGIRVDDGSPGTIIWTHYPEMGTTTRSRR